MIFWTGRNSVVDTVKHDLRAEHTIFNHCIFVVLQCVKVESFSLANQIEVFLGAMLLACIIDPPDC